jgi:uncharacterized membrane protein
MGAVAVHPAADHLDASPHIILRHELIRRLRGFLPPFILLPIAATIAALTLCRSTVMWPVDALGCILSPATIGITVAVNAPLNRRFTWWAPRALPGDWQEHIQRWNAAHSIRMATALGAFACAVLAGIE